jgi:hypothetical protein
MPWRETGRNADGFLANSRVDERGGMGSPETGVRIRDPHRPHAQLPIGSKSKSMIKSKKQNCHEADLNTRTTGT